MEHNAGTTQQHVQTRELYAIKVFSVFDREKRAQLLKEVETLRGMECPSLISFAGGYLKVRSASDTTGAWVKTGGHGHTRPWLCPVVRCAVL